MTLTGDMPAPIAMREYPPLTFLWLEITGFSGIRQSVV